MKNYINVVTKGITAALTLTFPFLAVWLCYIITAYSFDPRFVFAQNWFIIIAVVYYLFMCPLLVCLGIDNSKKES